VNRRIELVAWLVAALCWIALIMALVGEKVM
jgi:hypothetical protein